MPGLCKSIQRHERHHTLSNGCKSPHQAPGHMLITDDHFNLPHACEYAWVSTHFVSLGLLRDAWNVQE